MLFALPTKIFSLLESFHGEFSKLCHIDGKLNHKRFREFITIRSCLETFAGDITVGKFFEEKITQEEKNNKMFFI